MLLKDIKDPNLAIEDLLAIYDRLTIIPTRTIVEETTNIATTKNISVYDATYIAAAQKLNAPLYTADKKLATTANPTITTKTLHTNEQI